MLIKISYDYYTLWMGHILWLLRSIAPCKPCKGRVLCQSCSYKHTSTFSRHSDSAVFLRALTQLDSSTVALHSASPTPCSANHGEVRGPVRICFDLLVDISAHICHRAPGQCQGHRSKSLIMMMISRRAQSPPIEWYRMSRGTAAPASPSHMYRRSRLGVRGWNAAGNCTASLRTQQSFPQCCCKLWHLTTFQLVCQAGIQPSGDFSMKNVN